MRFQFVAEPSETQQILQSPELQDRVVIGIYHLRRYDMFGNDMGPLMEIEVEPQRVPQQVIMPMPDERISALELVTDMLMDEVV